MAKECNLKRLTRLHDYFVLRGDQYDMDICKDAHDEIERLRASRFRWIPVGERLPTVSDGLGLIGFVLTVLEGGSVGMTSWENIKRAHYTHWAPIPPLPEQSQADRDVEIWEEHVFRGGGSDRASFLAGMKAAREQKP